MKKFLYAIVMCLPLVALTSCSEDSDDPSKVTYYATVDLNGDEVMVIPAGVKFNDPGCSAEMRGQDVSDEVKVTTDMDLDNPKPGIYDVNYLVTNEDGFSAGSSRKVVVYAPGGNLPSGIYEADPARCNVNGVQSYYIYGPFDIIVYHVGGGVYACTDLFGGFYAQGRGYGNAYAMQGYFSDNGDGTLSYEESYLEGWGDSVDDAEVEYDAENKELHMVSSYVDGAMIFDVTMSYAQ